jgi:hypothetical protein
MEVASFTVSFSNHHNLQLRFDLLHFSNRTVVTLKCDGVKDKDFTSLLHEWDSFREHLENECCVFLTGDEWNKLHRVVEFNLDPGD